MGMPNFVPTKEDVEVWLAMADTDHNGRVEMDEYEDMGLSPKSLVTYWVFLLAVLMNTLSLPTPFSRRYNSQASDMSKVSFSWVSPDLTT